MSDIDVTKLPSPLAAAVFRMEQSVNCLRPNYVKGLMQLIDCAEIFLQLGALSALCAWRSQGIKECKGASKAVKFIRETFLNQPLSTGHYFQAWQLIGRVCSDPSQHPFGLYTSLVSGDLDTQYMNTISSLPQLRNKRKGHSFTPSEDEARKVWEKWYPKICQLFAGVMHVTEKYRLCFVSDSDGDTVELKILLGNVQPCEARVELVEVEGGLDRGLVVLATQEAISRRTLLSAADFIDLSPAVIFDEGQIYWYQGIRNKRAEYLNVDSGLHDEVDHESFRAGYSFLRDFAGSRRSESPAVPDWAKSLNGLEYLCDAVINPSEANPIGFYRGARCSWADIRESLDVSRMIECGDCRHDLVEFVSNNARAWISQAKAYEVPLFAVVGAAGAGKTTALWRMAYEIFKHHRDQCEIVRQLPGGPVDQESLSSMVENVGAKALCLIIDDGHKCLPSIENLRKTAREQELPIFILVAERTNIWPQHIGQLIKLEKLTDHGIDQLLDKLDQNDQLGVLKSFPQDERHERVKSGLGRELIVALKESTEGRRFDELILGEYSSLPTEHARRFYEQVCLCDCVGHHLPHYVAMSSMGCGRVSELRSKVLDDLEDVVRSDKTAYGRGYQSRHRLIAEVVISGIKDPQEMLDALSDLLLHLSLAKGARGGVWDSSISLAKALFTWPYFHELLTEDIDLTSLVRDMRQYGAALPRIIDSLGSNALRDNAGLLCFAEELLLDLLDSPTPVHSLAMSKVLSVLVASGELDRAAKLGGKAFDVYHDRPKDLSQFIKRYSSCLIEAGCEQEALGVIRSVIDGLDSSEYHPSLVSTVAAVLNPLCSIGHTQEAIELCHKAMESIPCGDISTMHSLAHQQCKLLNDNASYGDALELSERLIDKACENGVPKEKLKTLAHHASSAAAGLGVGEYTRLTLKLCSLSLAPNLRTLGGMLQLDEEGHFIGEPELIQLADKFAQTHGVVGMVIGSLKRQSEKGDCITLVSGRSLMSLVCNDPGLSNTTRSAMVFHWLKCAVIVWPSESTSCLLGQIESLHEGVNLTYLEEAFDFDMD